MGETTVSRESASEYFRDLVESAMRRQQIRIHEHTTFYVVNLLAGFVRVDHALGRAGDRPLAVQLATALQAAGTVQRAGLRDVGDRSLFVSGFFSDSLARSPVGIDYYIHLGEYAYGSLARHGHARLGEVFDELAAKFTEVVDVIGEVSERTALTSNADLLRLYDRWVRTGSRRSRAALLARGIVPSSSSGSRTIQ